MSVTPSIFQILKMRVTPLKPIISQKNDPKLIFFCPCFFKASIIEHNARVSDDFFEQKMERNWTKRKKHENW